MKVYTHKALGVSRNRPSYCQVVRNGLRTIAARVEPWNDEERRALQWIIEMHTWHTRIVQPAAHEEHKRRKKRREGARA